MIVLCCIWYHSLSFYSTMSSLFKYAS